MSALIDLSADLGEAFGPYHMANDAALLELLTSANVACGFHAGDPAVMDLTVRLCRERGVAVGAHPGFRDVVGFGRRSIEMSRDEVRTDVLYQMGALSAFTGALDVALTHVTPHGRLGNLCVTDSTYADGVIDAVLAFDATLPVVTQSGELERRARQAGLAVGLIGFADRAYNPDGTLISRRLPGAVLHDPGEITDRVSQLVEARTVLAMDGTVVDVDCDTILIHGDTPGAVELARSIHERLVADGVLLASLPAVLASRSNSTTS